MKSIYQDLPAFDFCPAHIWWAVNGCDFGPVTAGPAQEFSFDYRFDHGVPQLNFDVAVFQALERVARNAAGQQLAICISGRDSEVIARAAAELGTPAKLYFLRLWGSNDWILPYLEGISADTGLELVSVTLDRDHFLEQLMLQNFRLLGVHKPTYLCLPYLFEQIPHDEFIVVGEGDVSKDNPDYAQFFTAGRRGVPVVTTEIAYRTWAQVKRRLGEYYFHASTPELLLSAYFDPATQFRPPKIYTEQLYRKFWPNLRFDVKTDNWEEQHAINSIIVRSTKALRTGILPATGCLIPHESFEKGLTND